jgi:EF hand
MSRTLALAGVVLVAAAAGGAEPVRHRGEFLQMWDAIVSGSQMGPGDGWFKPGQARYTSARLVARFDKNKDGRVTAEELGRPELFAILDRDGDGAITAADLDWSDESPYFRQLGLAQQLIRRGDRNGDRKLSKDEWGKLFDELAKDKGMMDAEAVRRVLFPVALPRTAKSGGGGGPPKEMLLLGLLSGELGSGAEGPRIETPAPNFTLQSPDGKRSITLSDYRGKKPVVLIFGSFT